MRPDHRMVGHTGFLTTARLLVPFDDREPGPAPNRTGLTGTGVLGRAEWTARPSVDGDEPDGGTSVERAEYGSGRMGSGTGQPSRVVGVSSAR